MNQYEAEREETFSIKWEELSVKVEQQSCKTDTRHFMKYHLDFQLICNVWAYINNPDGCNILLNISASTKQKLVFKACIVSNTSVLGQKAPL